MASAILMLAGFFMGRAALSIAMALFVIASAVCFNKEDWQVFRKSGFLHMMMMLFLIPFVSGLWSGNFSNWMGMMQVKLPLLILPVCAVLLRRFSAKDFQYISFAFIVAAVLACCYSLWQYSFQPVAIQQTYLKAKVLPVPLSGDHIRFAWAVLIAYLLLFELLLAKFKSISYKWKAAAITGLVFFAVYLHILSAKTGIIGFYLVNLVILFYCLRTRKILFTALLALLVCLPIAAYYVFPTFQNKVKFIKWDYQNYSRGTYVEGLPDAARILSFRAGLYIITSHPVTGVGFGDIYNETNKWYNSNAAFLKEYERLYPSNEWLMHGCGAGTGGMIIFTVVVLLPLFISPPNKNFLWTGFHLLALFNFLYESSLGVQYGVFLYSFFGCWSYWYSRRVNG